MTLKHRGDESVQSFVAARRDTIFFSSDVLYPCLMLMLCVCVCAQTGLCVYLSVWVKSIQCLHHVFVYFFGRAPVCVCVCVRWYIFIPKRYRFVCVSDAPDKV